jgi:pyruvate dehydrogenase kinase 2/3/4
MFLSPASSIAGLKSISPKDQKPFSLGNGSESTIGDGNGNKYGGKKMRIPMARRYYYNAEQTMDVVWPPEVYEYNKRFTKLLDNIKKRHDPTVTTVAGGVLEWKRKNRSKIIGSDVQRFLDRFYMSRIGIRFLIGQRRYIETLLDQS